MALPQLHPLYDADSPLMPSDLPSSAEMDRLFRASEGAVFDAAFAPGAGVPRPVLPRPFPNEEGEVFWNAFR